MSTRYNNGAHYENHPRAAELHDIAAHSHRTAEETHEKQEHPTGTEQTRRALEHTQPSHDHSGSSHPGAVNEHGFPVFGHDEIAALAYELWQARGCPEGSPEVDWLRAANELRDRKESLEK